MIKVIFTAGENQYLIRYIADDHNKFVNAVGYAAKNNQKEGI